MPGYTYTVEISEVDGCYVGRCEEFDFVAAHGETPEAALNEIMNAVAEVIADMEAHGERVPKPTGQH